MVLPERIDAVVFDMGGVFIVPDPTVVSEILRRGGLECEIPTELAAEAHYAGVRRITELLALQTGPENDLDIWVHYDCEAFGCVGIVGSDLDRAIEVRAVARRYGRGLHKVWRYPLEANTAAFHRMSSVRPVAIVSNNDGTAVDQCRNFGVCQLEPDGPLPHVPAIVDSTTIGIGKPDPAIFDPALGELGTARDCTLYVGDTVHTDVLGAGRAGLPMVQLDPLDFRVDHDHWRLADLDALARHLGA